MDNNELLQAIKQVVREEITSQLEPINGRLDKLQDNVNEINFKLETIQEDIEIIKEDSAITRTGVNKLLDWADDPSIQELPLSKVSNG